jgi:hypothetical protein
MSKNLEQNEVLFNRTLAMLKHKIISYHDEKAKNESFINEDYLEYLALKYTSKTMKDICDTHDTEALETIINQLK